MKYGLDLSENNDYTLKNPIAWDIIQDSKFTDFVILRRGFGVSAEEDSNYLEYYNKAKSIGIDDISSYWFSYALDPDEARQEAYNYLDMTNNDNLALNRMILDLEMNSKFQRNGISKLTSNFVNGQMKAFLKVLIDHGMNVAIYSSQWVFEDLYDMEWIEDNNVAIWNACYGNKDYIKGWMWQYTESEYIRDLGPFDANIKYE